MAEQELDISVVIPCLNEAETIGTCIGKARAAFDTCGVVGEVVVGDNGSTDGSQDIAIRAGARVVQVERRGYGAALIGAIGATRGRYLIMGDADDSYDFGEIGAFVSKLRGGADFVIGCRLPGGGGRILPGAMPPLHRWLGTPVLTALSRLFFRTKIRDINCGMRGFSRDAVARMELRSPGMEFASEMVMKAALLGLRTAEVPITLHPDGRSRPPHLRTWRDGWRHLRFMLLYSPRWLFVIPGLVLFAIGISGVLSLAMGPVPVGDVVFSLNTHIVCAMLTIFGFQVLAFGLFAKSFALSQGMLPRGRPSDRIISVLRLEHTVIAGAVIMLVGLGLLFWAVWVWGTVGFGQLDPLEVPRIVIPSVTLVILGAQAVFTGFVLGLLRLTRPDD
jgi:glycosyltransferase involved in cell wall biosynthesis